MNDRFIYCIDENEKQNLLDNGYRLITTQFNNNQKIHIFENKNNKKFNQNQNQKKIYTTNRLNF